MRSFGASRVLRTAAALLATLLLPAHAQDSDLDRIRQEIASLQQRLAQVRSEARSAERELAEADLELGIRTQELELAAAAERALETEQNATEAQIAVLGPRLEQQKQELGRRAAALYRLGGLSYLRVALSLEERRNPLQAMSMLSYLVSRDARMVRRFRETSEELKQRRATLGVRRQALREARTVVERRRRDVASAVARKQAVLARLRRQESGAEQQLAALEEKARRLQRLVDALSRQKRGLDPEIDIRSVQGALDWPLRGKVIERFGRQRNAKFATVTLNNGVKIEARPGAEVRAVFQGTVLFSQWFKGYGNLIILDHGKRVFSLYGNLKSVSVAAGDRVLTGQTIAGVAEGEEPGTGYLYFEVRQDNKPEDPQRWLR